MKCSGCGGPRDRAPQRYCHDDYGKPLAVRWLCRAHHLTCHVKTNPGRGDR